MSHFESNILPAHFGLLCRGQLSVGRYCGGGGGGGGAAAGDAAAAALVAGDNSDGSFAGVGRSVGGCGFVAC